MNVAIGGISAITHDAPFPTQIAFRKKRCYKI